MKTILIQQVEQPMPIQGSQLSFPHNIKVDSILSVDIITFNDPHHIIYGQVNNYFLKFCLLKLVSLVKSS